MQLRKLIEAGRGGSWWALLGILVLVAHASLFGVGPVGADFETLVDASRGVYSDLGGVADGGVESLFNRAGTAGRPLAAWSLGLSSWIWTSGGVWTPFAASGMRLENLLWLVIVAYLLSRLLRRLLTPWTDSDQASAAASAALFVLLVHPLSVSAVASPAARGDLIAAALGLLAGAAFLRGRQDRDHGFLILAALATLLATQASELGYLIPIWLGLIEFTSSRRYRPGHSRIRTALTTVVVFGAFAGVDVLVRIGLGIDPWPMELRDSLTAMTSFSGAVGVLLGGLTKLGVLILPVNGANAGAFGFIFAALLLVAVIQPALHAGLSAPRFWITLLCIWLALVLITEAMRATLYVGPNDFSASAGLFPAVLIMAVGLGVASTAVSGSRRQGLPLVVVCLLCALARSNARGWRAAAKDAHEFHSELSEVIASEGDVPHYLVIDPPGLVDLYQATPLELGWVFDEAITGLPLRAERLDFTRVSEEALLNFARLKEFDDLRSQGLVILFQNRRVNPKGPSVWGSVHLEPDAEAGTVLEWRNPAGGAGDGRALATAGHWVGPDLDQPFVADSGAIELITVRGRTDPESDRLSELPDALLPEAQIYWRARGGLVQGGLLTGFWFRTKDQAHQAAFDSGSSLTWLLGPRVDSLLLMGDLAESPGAEVWSRPPEVSGRLEPEVDDEDWHLGIPDSAGLENTELTEEWFLTLLDLESLAFFEILCEVDGEGALLAPDAEEISQFLRSSPGSLAWGVERRIGGAVIERSGGRL